MDVWIRGFELADEFLGIPTSHADALLLTCCNHGSMFDIAYLRKKIENEPKSILLFIKMAHSKTGNLLVRFSKGPVELNDFLELLVGCLI